MLSACSPQLDEVSSRAMTRARLAQAEADIVSQSSRRREPGDLVESALRRIGDELEASVGVAFFVRDGHWCGEAALRQVGARSARAALPVRLAHAPASRARA